MNSRRFIAVAALAALVIMGTGLSCKNVGIPTISGPSETYQGAPTTISFLATGSGNVDFVVDWGDAMVDTLTDNSPGDTLKKAHTWADAGDFKIKSMAMLTDDNTTMSEYSPEFAIKVLPNGAPVAQFQAPMQGVIDVETQFRVWGSDPDGEDVAFRLKVGDDLTDWSGFVASGETTTVVYTFKTEGETLEVKAQARDIHTTEGPWSDPQTITTTSAGGLLWYWQTDNEDLETGVTAPVLAEDEGQWIVYTGAEDENAEFYGIDVANGKKEHDGTTVLSEEYSWYTHAAYNWSTGHIIVAKDDGEVYAFKRNLGREWHWPGYTTEETLTENEWWHPAISGQYIFMATNDTVIAGSDTVRATKFYKITDGLNQPPDILPHYNIPGTVPVGAPVIDNAINLFFLTDSGFLYKLSSNLEFKWRVPVSATIQDMQGPVLGPGVVYVATEDGRLRAFNTSDGTPKWDVAVPSVGAEMYPVVGQSQIFIATDLGHLVCLNLDGTQKFDAVVTTASTIEKYPILAKAGYIYVQDDADVLHCLSRSNGSEFWKLDCPVAAGLVRGLRQANVDEPLPSPTMTTTGNIILAGEEAVYCVSGYKDGTLDDGAPWPKWQADLGNTGKMIGGF